MNSSGTPLYVKCDTQHRIHRAGWIVADSSNIIENGYIETADGIIQAVCQGNPGKNDIVIDYGPGAIMPALVNAHVHLELSALKGQVAFDMGFRSWVRSLIEKRQAIGKDRLVDMACRAADDMVAKGNLFCADISTLGISRALAACSDLQGIFFHEFLGHETGYEYCVNRNDSVSFSLAGHGPHTTSPQLLCELKKKSRSACLPFSIHVAESEDESEFIQTRAGQWAQFLTERGIDWSCWNIGSKTPVEYIYDLGLLDPLTLAVHALNTNDRDLDILAESGTRVCVCPRSNKNLHGKMPDIFKMVEKGISPALGTDSLASCDSLDIFDEMAFVTRYWPELDPETIFSMATVNGARAIGMENSIGTLCQGAASTFIYKPLTAGNESQVMEKIVSNES